MVFIFKYVGSFVSGADGIRFLADSVVAGATKVTGALQSGCKSVVALLISRLVDLHHALVDPIALLNGVAWVPFLEWGGPWFFSMCKRWWLVVGYLPQPSKDYVLTSWLDFGLWEQTVVQMLLKFTKQLVEAPRGS